MFRDLRTMAGNPAKRSSRKEPFQIPMKFFVIGPHASGKTELCNRFAKRNFRDRLCEDYQGIVFRQGEVELIIYFLDTPGQEEAFRLNELYVKGADGVVFVYDITDKNSFVKTKEWMERLKPEICKRAVIVVGNKCDLEQRREVSKLKGYELAFEHGVKFYEVSAKTNANVQEAENTILTCAVARMYGKNSKKTKVPEEIMQDPYATLLYEKALQAGTEKDRSIRVNIVGNFRQGKTTLMRRLMGQKIKGIKSTDGIFVEHCKCEKTKDEKLRYSKAGDLDKSEYVKRLVSGAVGEKNKDKEQKTQPLTESSVSHEETTRKVLEDSANPENVGDFQNNLNTDTTRVSSSGIEVVDASLNKIELFTKALKTNQASPQQDKHVSSNGIDVIDESLNKNSILSPKEKELFTKALKTKQLSPQEEKQTIFDIWDFGGQYIFYATHTIFHSWRAIYLLVFDLTLDLKQCINDELYPTESENRSMAYFIQFWLSSIHSFVGSADGSLPKVILVGTHKDKLKGKRHERERYIKTYFDDIRQMFDETDLFNHIHSVDFAVDNTDAKDPSLNLLRETIIRIGEEQSGTFEIPLKWIQLERSLLERKHLKLISIEFVLAIDLENEFPLSDINQVKLFLQYHHVKGTFVYFDENPISEYVVLDPQYLIDAFKCIITSERFCTNDPEMRPLWKMLLSEGRLEKRLIDHQWGKGEDKFEMYAENKDILLSFLVKHRIISEATNFDENMQKSIGLGWFVVPSLLKDHTTRAELKNFLSGKKRTKLRYVLLFNISPVVPTIYHRLVSAAIGKWPVTKAGKETLIFKDICIVRLNYDHAGIVEMKHNSIEMSVVSLCPTTDISGEQADSFRRFSEAVVANEFQRLRNTTEIHAKPYTIWFRCNHEQHGDDGSEHLITKEDMGSGNIVPCPDLLNHEIDVEKSKGEWFQDNRNIPTIPDIKLTDKLLGNISQCIGENWQFLGLELGLTQVQIDHIVEDHPNSAVMRIYVMLQNWCRDDTDTTTLKILVETVKQCTHVHVDWDTLKNIIDELN